MVKRGEAGRRGDAVRSDCWTEVVLTEGGGRKIRLESKVIFPVPSLHPEAGR